MSVDGMPWVVGLDQGKVTAGPDFPQTPSYGHGEMWSPDGRWTVSGESLETQVWESKENDLNKSRRSIPGASLAAIIRWSSDGKRFLAYLGVTGTEYAAWSGETLQQVSAFKLPSGVFAASWSPDGTQIAIGGGGGEVLVLDGKDGKVVRSWKTDADPEELRNVSNIAWSRKGDRLAVVYYLHQHDALVIDAADGRIQFPLKNAPMGSSNQRLLWGPEDNRVLVIGDQELAVYSGDDGEYQTAFAVKANSRAVYFVDQDTILCGARDGFVYRLDLASGKQEIVAKDLGDVVEISPDGQLLATELGGVRRIHRLDGTQISSFVSTRHEPYVISAEGHVWTPDNPRGPFWATKGTLPHTLVYVVQTAAGQQTLTPLEIAERYGWRNDPSQVRLK